MALAGYGGEFDETIPNELTLMRLPAGFLIMDPLTTIRWPACEIGSE